MAVENTEITFEEIQEKDLFGNIIESYKDEEEEEEVEVPKAKETSKPKEKEVTTKKEEIAEETPAEIESPDIAGLLFGESAAKDTDGKEVIKKAEKDGKDYNSLAKELVDLGIWKEFKSEDGEELDLDEETFNKLKELQAETKITELKDKNLSKVEQEYLEFKKNGGDFESYANASKFQEQATNLDISTMEGKQTAVYSYYKNIVGWSPERAAKYVEDSIKNLNIDEDADFAKEKLEEKANAALDKVRREEQDRLQKIATEQESFEKTLKEELANIGFNTKQLGQVSKDFKVNQEENLANIDKKYLELKSDPKQAAILWNLLFDQENYLKSYSNKKVNDASLKAFEGITLSKKVRTRTSASDEDKQPKGIVLI